MKKFTLYLLLLLPLVSAWGYQKERIYVNSGGKQRNMLVFTPDELPAGSPLFITTHGMGGNSDEQSEHDKMYELIDTAKFVMCYPKADGDYWDISGTTDQNFIIKVIDEMASRYNINRKRVYWSGFSMGSMLIFHCMPNMLDKIAAFAPTSGIQFSEEPWKKCAWKVNVMECIAYNDNAFTYNKYNIRGYMENMANMNRYTRYEKKTGYHTKNGTSWFDGDRELWLNEKTGHEVVLYSYNYSGKGSHTPVAENSYEIWNWCKRFELTPKTPENSTQGESETVHLEATTDNVWAAGPNSGIASGSDITFDGMKVTIGSPDDPATWSWHAGNQGLIPSQMPSTEGTAESLVTAFAETEPFGVLPTHGAFLKIEPTSSGRVTISGKASSNVAQPLVFVTCDKSDPAMIEAVKTMPWDNSVTQWTYDVDAQHTYYFFQQAYPGQLTAYRFTLRGIAYERSIDTAIKDILSDADLSTNSPKRSAEAEHLLQCLKAIEGQKTLSGAMACVNWNLNEAKWVHQHTGKWPALNGFDYIHHPFSSKGGWIDYTNINEVASWNSQGGVVCIMWHWNVPANKSGDYSFYWGTEADKTTFDVRKIFNPESSEYKQMIKDIDQIAGYLKLLRQANIPVLWRPLHEAGGMWFWWGRDPDACNELWRVMYRRFQDAGLDNLIWVWTQSSAWGKPYSDGYRWYPGDDYVDIVSIDVYNNSNAASIYTSCYKFLSEYSPTKFVALTECGNVPNISKQWNAGSKWLFFMPWYDYGRTNNPSSSDFKSTGHSSCNAAWWKEAFTNNFVLTRDDIKALRQTTSGIEKNSNSAKDGIMYDMSGRRVANPQHGLYIVNGKKMLVK